MAMLLVWGKPLFAWLDNDLTNELTFVNKKRALRRSFLCVFRFEWRKSSKIGVKYGSSQRIYCLNSYYNYSKNRVNTFL